MGFPAAAALLVFAAVIAAVIFLVLRPQQFKVHLYERTCTIPISYCWMPLLGVVLLLICQSLDMNGVGQGLKGDEHIQPYGILILFMALAYIAASLDCTGVFAWLALRITQASQGRGHLLFFLMYGLSAVMTALTSNDVSIMTLTPIIIYFSRATKCDPMPFLTAEFVAANLWSMLLFVGVFALTAAATACSALGLELLLSAIGVCCGNDAGNPTNIIVAQAYKMSFIGYTKWMALPTIVAGLVSVLHLYWVMRSRLPVQLTLPDINPGSMLTDKVGAYFGCANMGLCLLLLALAPTLAWDMWLITLVCALVHAIYNVVAGVSLDPVTGQWVGIATLMGRKVDTIEERKSTITSYSPQTMDEQEADAILMQECGPSADYRPSKPHAPKQSFFALLSSTLASTLQAKPHGHGSPPASRRRSSHSGVGMTTSTGFAPPSPVSNASPTWRSSSQRGISNALPGFFTHNRLISFVSRGSETSGPGSTKGLSGPSLSRGSIGQLGTSRISLTEEHNRHHHLQIDDMRTASISRSLSWGQGLSTAVLAEGEGGAGTEGMGVGTGMDGGMGGLASGAGTAREPISSIGKGVVMGPISEVDMVREGLGVRTSAPLSRGATGARSHVSPRSVSTHASPSQGVSRGVGAVSVWPLPSMPADPESQGAGTGAKQQPVSVEKRLGSVVGVGSGSQPATPATAAAYSRQLSLANQGSGSTRELRRAGSDKAQNTGKVATGGVAGEGGLGVDVPPVNIRVGGRGGTMRDSSGVLDSPTGEWSGASGPSTLLLATPSTLEDVRLAWRREQQQVPHQHILHSVAMRGKSSHGPSPSNSHHGASSHTKKSVMTAHGDSSGSGSVVDGGGGGGQRGEGGGRSAGSQSRVLVVGSKGGVTGGGRGQDHDRHSNSDHSRQGGADVVGSSHGTGLMGSAAGLSHQNGWIQNALVELAWRPPGVLGGGEEVRGGADGMRRDAGRDASVGMAAPEQVAKKKVVWEGDGGGGRGGSVDGLDTERTRLLSSVPGRSSGSGVLERNGLYAWQAKGGGEDVEEGVGSGMGAQTERGRSQENGGQGEGGEDGDVDHFEGLEPPSRSFIRTLMSLPWEVVPFVLGMFVLVEALEVQGWIEALSKVLGSASGSGRTGGTLFLMGSLSVAMANVINNQPMTILLTRVCLQPVFMSSASHDGKEDDPMARDVQRTALFALVVGSNVGALFTLIGALAGIMWSNIMKGMNVTITYTQFMRLMLPIGMTSMLATLLVLWVEFGLV